MSFGFYARCLFVLPEGVAGVPQIEQETVSQFALSLVHVRNELEIHLGMLCRVVVGMPGPAGQGLQESVAVGRPEVDVGTVLAVIPVCPAYAALFRIDHRGLGVCHVLRDICFMRLGLLSGSLLERNDAGWGFGPLAFCSDKYTIVARRLKTTAFLKYGLRFLMSWNIIENRI